MFHSWSNNMIFIPICVELKIYLSNVWIGCFRINPPVGNHVSERVGHVSTSAAVVICDAVHQVLGTQVHQLARRLGQQTLKSTG